MTADTLDALRIGNSYAELPGEFYTFLQPQPLTDPRLLHANPQVADMLGLDAAALA